MGLGREALAQLLRRLLFNVLAANNDDHTKNLSFLLRQGGRWELAPAYDITHAFNPDKLWIRQHLMSVNGHFNGISRADVRLLAERFALLAELPEAIEQVQAAIAHWPGFARAAGVDEAEARTIGQHMAQRAALFVG